MSSFVSKFGDLTVAEALELNEAAKWYCSHEVVSNSEEI